MKTSRRSASFAILAGALGTLGCSGAPGPQIGPPMANASPGGASTVSDDAAAPTTSNGGGGGSAVANDNDAAVANANDAAAVATSEDAGATSPSSPGAPVGEAGVDGGTGGGASADGAAAVTPGLHVVTGSNGAPGHIVDGAGNVVALHGVNRSGTEYECLSGSFSDGPVDQAGIDAMKTWNVNAVRVPLNEDCWLGINGVPSAFSGASYQNAIESWVNLLAQNGMIVIVDLHWTAPGTTLAQAQAPMADADHSPTVWSQVAAMFAQQNGSVIFDLFNEPFITDWGCWVSGGACAQLNGQSYSVAGMASLLGAVRGAGAENVVILGGLSYSSDMSQWVSSVNGIPNLAAPLNGISVRNVAASWHAYDFNSEQTGCPSQYNGYAASLTCNSAAVTATNTSATTVLAAGFPLVIGETGISGYSASSAAAFKAAQISDLETWFDGLLGWAEMEGQGYLAWSWNTDTPPVLVTDYTGTPTEDFGQTYKAHLASF